MQHQSGTNARISAGKCAETYMQIYASKKDYILIRQNIGTRHLLFAMMAHTVYHNMARSPEIAPAIDVVLNDDCPFFVDLVLEGDVHPEQIGIRYGQ